MKPAVKLKLNGKPFPLHPTIPSAEKTKRFLDSQPSDEIFTSDELSKRTGVAANVYRGYLGSMEEMQTYCLRNGRYRYWGNPKAIDELKRQTEAFQ